MKNYEKPEILRKTKFCFFYSNTLTLKRITIAIDILNLYVFMTIFRKKTNENYGLN